MILHKNTGVFDNEHTLPHRLRPRPVTVTVITLQLSRIQLTTFALNHPQTITVIHIIMVSVGMCRVLLVHGTWNHFQFGNIVLFTWKLHLLKLYYTSFILIIDLICLLIIINLISNVFILVSVPLITYV